ncbi:asparagine synthase (glutamine-hydrolyzing) [Pedobacter sp. D749]|uniref:asparagine synthase (glutamine-hydrolyzing) n=1 Tax=Pedobacter sp. D749 TaxID=2856523 RepID=UPI0010473F07|nr:asparagine synthase (glutamine-hydrolyzing) [Pedobacter sp. D749]QXU42350.1 asparagine synthase (glutamine-hydrolyzing) [Pedobacter sp. D749]
MCRIAGIINSKKSFEQVNQQVKAMCDSMQHGGPDDRGIYAIDKMPLCLGNRRLAILDLSSSGHQPMISHNGDLVITYNGEIYNYRQIRTELINLGYVFKSQTDTEVILYAYQHWGEAAFEKLDGLFAFCIFDKRKQCIYLVRDQNGIKPLYYHFDKETLTFASEVKAFKHADINQENDNWRIYYLAFGHIPEPYTTLKDVFSLGKGCFLKYNMRSAEHFIQSYHEFESSSNIKNESHAIERIREQLSLSIKQQMISDVDIGVLFSGGLDSSIITMLANQFNNKQLHSISANFNEIDFSEKKQRNSLLQKINVKKIEQLITYRDFLQHFETILADMDQPTNDGINTWFVCKTAKEQGIKVVLSGLGADELFGGYPSFDRIYKIQDLNWLSKSVLRNMRFSNNTRFKRLYYLSLNSPIGEYLCLRGVYSPDVIAELLDIDMTEIINCLENIPLHPAIKRTSNETRASWFEFNMYMQNQLLKDTDFMSMSHGVEVRVPFLDRNFVNLVLSISTDIKFSYKQKKKLLVEAYKEDLPTETWKRSKMGFTFPFQEWMRKNRDIADPSRYQNKRAKSLIKSFGENKLHWSSALALYQTYHVS